MRRKRKQEDLALQRIERLFAIAETAARTEQDDRCRRYLELARTIGMRYRVRIPRELKARLCRRCHGLLIPGKTARIRLRGEYLATTCLSCGEQMRRPYKAPRPPSARRLKP